MTFRISILFLFLLLCFINTPESVVAQNNKAKRLDFNFPEWLSKTICDLQVTLDYYHNDSLIKNSLLSKEIFIIDQVDSTSLRGKSFLFIDSLSKKISISLVVEDFFFGEQFIYKLHVKTNNDSLYSYVLKDQSFVLYNRKKVEVSFKKLNKMENCHNGISENYFIVTSFEDNISVKNIFFTCSNQYKLLYNLLNF